jgi:23S rRNA pseudouridine2605 synthase
VNKKNKTPPRGAALVSEITDEKLPGENLSGEKLHGEKLQKVMAQAGYGSRREMEEWIASGRVSVNGEPATLGMRVIEGDLVKAGARSIRVGERENAVRVLLYHKPEGEIVSRDDPEKRTSVFDKLPRLRGQKWTAIGRLDFNTSGLLIFTTSGELANRLMHPRFEVEREYAVRVQGTLTEEQITNLLKEGVDLDDGPVKFEKLEDEGGEGFNHWYRVMLKEGRNRVVRRTFDALGLPVSRLMRVRFGIINLPPRLKRGMVAELGEGEVAQVLDWSGLIVNNEEQSSSSPLRKTNHARSEKSRNTADVLLGGGRGVAGRAKSVKSSTGAKR